MDPLVKIGPELGRYPQNARCPRKCVIEERVVPNYIVRATLLSVTAPVACLRNCVRTSRAIRRAVAHQANGRMGVKQYVQAPLNYVTVVKDRPMLHARELLRLRTSSKCPRHS